MEEQKVKPRMRVITGILSIVSFLSAWMMYLVKDTIVSEQRLLIAISTLAILGIAGGLFALVPKIGMAGLRIISFAVLLIYIGAIVVNFVIPLIKGEEVSINPGGIIVAIILIPGCFSFAFSGKGGFKKIF